MSSKPVLQLSNNASLIPPSNLPPSPRKLRKFQSHQTLSSNSFHSTSQQPATSQSSTSQTRHAQNQNEPAQNASADRAPSHRRARSNSDLGAGIATPLVTQRRPARKTGSLGFGGKRSNLENLLREGPPTGKLAEALHDLRYLVLSARVEADSDGMSTHRIYLWLALLNISPMPTDEYLSLVHRGRSPAYAKIRNDTFRTLATDPLFKRRVTEASLIRLLNAVAWRLHDDTHGKPSSRPSSRRKELELSIDSPPTIQEEPDQESTASATAVSVEGKGHKSAIYVQGMNVLCAPFLYAARSEVEAFALFHYFITKECPGYIRGAMDGVHKGLRLVDRCLEIVEPKLANHLFSKGMKAELYAFPSVLTLCACTPPLPEVLHLWDFLFAYGPHLNILCIVAQLIRMRDVILESPSPNKVLRSLHALNAKEIIALTVLLVGKIPDDLYAELVQHAK